MSVGNEAMATGHSFTVIARAYLASGFFYGTF